MGLDSFWQYNLDNNSQICFYKAVQIKAKAKITVDGALTLIHAHFANSDLRSSGTKSGCESPEKAGYYLIF
jgi:hypothetical protein